MSVPIVLLIDDDTLLATMIRLALDSNGLTCQLQYASDGVLGLELAEYHQPQVILLDYQMPGLDGWETLMRLRTNPKTALIPVVTISGAIASRGRCAEMVAASNAYLPKPLNFEKLCAVVAQFIVVRETK